MVELRKYFFTCQFLKKLNEVSDNCCDDNGYKYIDFDSFAGNKIASVDSLIIKDDYLLFVEFKKFDEFKDEEDLKKHLNTREKNQQIILKGYESYFLVFNLCNNLKIKDKFESIEKRFILVYKANNFKNKINNHFKHKIDHLKIAYDKAFPIECERFKKLLKRIENVF